MSIIEQMELVRHHNDIICDVRCLVEKYREIFRLELPEYDEKTADKFIMAEIRNALKYTEKELLS